MEGKQIIMSRLIDRDVLLSAKQLFIPQAINIELNLLGL